MASGIYTITCEANGKAYVGSGINIARRWKYHRQRMRQGKHDNGRMQNAWNKYGEESFIFAVVEHCDTCDLISREQSYLDSGTFLFNIAKTAGAPMAGRKHSPETRARLSAVLIGHKRTLGLRLSPETRQKMSASHRGMKHSAESIEKMRRVQKAIAKPPPGCDNRGRVHTATARANMSASKMGNTNWLGKKRSAETKAKISASLLRCYAEGRRGVS